SSSTSKRFFPDVPQMGLALGRSRHEARHDHASLLGVLVLLDRQSTARPVPGKGSRDSSRADRIVQSVEGTWALREARREGDRAVHAGNDEAKIEGDR